MSITSTSTISRKRSFSSTTAFNTVAENSSIINSINPSIDDKIIVETNSNQSFGKRKKLHDQNKIEYVTTTTTRRRRRRQVVTDHSSTITTTTNIEKSSCRSSSQRSIPAFLHKLYNMVNDSLTTQFIRWSKDGNSFLVENHEKFAELVLPRFYKHNTFASFVRQLNMYDFHKIPHIQQGVMITVDNIENELWEFSHQNFKRDRPDLLISIARKRNKDRNAVDMETMDLNSVAKEISVIKKHQTNITTDLKNLKKDNETLWKEVLAARENNSRHEEVISKILQFFTVVFSNGLPQLNNTAIKDQLMQLRKQQGQQETNKQDDSSNNHECLFSSSQTNTAGNTSSDFTSTSENENNSEDDFGDSNFDNNLMKEDIAQKLPPKTTNNAEILDIHLPFNEEIFHTEYFYNEFDNIKVPGDPASSVFHTTLLGKESYHTSRSAEVITNDINELQDDVETLVAQLGVGPEPFSDKRVEFEDLANSCNNMISSASKNDKLKLLELAATQVLPQTQTLTQFAHSGDTKLSHQPIQPSLNQLNSHHAPCALSIHSSDSSSKPGFSTSAEPYRVDPDATKLAHNFYQSNIIHTTTPKINAHSVNGQIDRTLFKSNMFTATKENTKPDYDLKHCNYQTDELFRTNISIQQRLQTSKYHPPHHPHNPSYLNYHHSPGQGSSYNNQQIHQTSFNTMLSGSVSSYQATYNNFNNSQRLQ